MDPYEQQAHDIICMIRYGSPGGSVRNEEIRRIANYLRGGPKVAIPVIRIPGSNPPPRGPRPAPPPNPPAIPKIGVSIKYPTEIHIPIVFPKVPPP